MRGCESLKEERPVWREQAEGHPVRKYLPIRRVPIYNGEGIFLIMPPIFLILG